MQTALEARVFDLLAEGLPTMKIAEQTGLSYKSVMKAEERLREKYGLSGRCSRVRLAVRAYMEKYGNDEIRCDAVSL